MPNNAPQPTVYIPTFDGNIEHGGFDATVYAGQLGSRVIIKESDGTARTYQRVVNDSSVNNVPAEALVAFWRDRAAYKVTMYIADAGRGNVAGVFRNNDTGALGTLAASDGCFIQIGGPSQVKFVDSPTAAPTTAGLIVIPSATDGKADCLAAGSAATYPAMGTSAGTQDGTTKKALVQLTLDGQP